jgi:hypothetical protein
MALLKRKTPEDKFADEVAGVAQSLLNASVTRRPEFALDISIPGRSTVTMFLDNVYRESHGVPKDERLARLRTAVFAMNAPERPQTWDEARGQLLPAVRATSWVTAAGDKVLSKPFLPLTKTLVAIDSEHAMTYVVEEDLDRWGVDLDAVADEAQANLSGYAIPHERLGAGWVITGPDGYASSWLTQPKRLLALAEDLAAPVIVFAPSRDVVVVTSASDPALEQLQRQMIQTYQEAPRSLSPCPYVVEAGGLSPWLPPAGTSSAELASRAAHLLELVEHEDQTARLEKEFEESGEDTYSGAYGVGEGAGEDLWSFTTWARGVSSGLLPRADVVALIDVDGGDPPLLVRWDDVMKHAAGALTPRAGLDPPRWHYTGWPSEAAMAKLAECRTEPPKR